MVPGIIKHNIRSKVHLIVHQMLPKPPSEVISSHVRQLRERGKRSTVHLRRLAQAEKGAERRQAPACWRSAWWGQDRRGKARER